MTDPGGDSSEPVPQTIPRSSLVNLIRKFLLLAVLAVVFWQLMTLGRQIDWSQMRLRPGWLIAAVGTYLAGWLPCVWYWRKLIILQGVTVPWHVVLRSHYCGQLGKYIPGKAAALLIRGEMVRPWGVPLLAGVMTAGFESLATMAVGGAVAVSLAPFVLTQEQWAHLGLPDMKLAGLQGIIVGLLLIVTLLLIPLLTHVMNLVLRRIVRKVVKNEPALREVRPPHWAFLALTLTWWLHGLSLGCTIEAVGLDLPLLANWPRWTAAASLGTVIGFVVLFAPGGAGVREGVLLTLLQGELGPQAALVVVLLRIVWLISELSTAGILFLIPRLFPSKV